MKYSRVFILMLFVAALVLSSLAPAAAQDTVTLVLWHAKQDAEGDTMLELIDAFNASQDAVVVEAVYNPSDTLQDSFRTAAGAGEGPDIIIWANDATGNFASAGLIAPITDMVDEELMAQATDSAWGTATYNGDIYGVPFSAKTLTMFYNMALIDEPETWEDVLDYSEELAEDGLVGLAFQNGFFHSAGFLYSLGGSLMDEDGNANFADGTEGADAMDAFLQFHSDLYQLSLDEESGVLVDGSSPNPAFQQGEVAMVYDGIWNLAQYEEDLGDDLGVVTMPTLDNGEVPALFAQTEVYFFNAALADDEAKVAGAYAWGLFVTSVEGQTIAANGGLMPVNPEVELENPNLQTFAEQSAYGTPFPNRAEMGCFWGPMGDAIAAVSEGETDPAEARMAAYELVQECIDGIHAE